MRPTNFQFLPGYWSSHLDKTKNLDIIHGFVYNHSGDYGGEGEIEKESLFISQVIHDSALNGEGLPVLGYSAEVKVLESLVIKIWQHLLQDKTELVAVGGEPIKIIYPGRSNDDRGADFRDAVIAINGKLVTGDIEVHTKSGDWQAHRHQNNPVYNRVILHVVMWDDTGRATNLHNGKTIPTIVLHKYIENPISQWANLAHPPPRLCMPCLKAAERLTTGVIAKFLDNAGEERFLAKARRFQTDLDQMGAGQCLYQGIMGALGYSKNKVPMLKLAGGLPLRLLESITQGEISDGECLARQQALLLGTAGLLPSQRPDWHLGNDNKWVDKLEGLWVSSGQTRAMSSNAWHLFKVRPSNFPIRRIVAMSYLILRYKQKGILAESVNMVSEVAISKSHHRLEQWLMVTANDYWASHFDFGSGCGIKAPTLLGSRRAADIVVNVVLPLACAWSQVNPHSELERKAVDLYRSYPRLAVNAVERHMKHQLGLNSSLVNSARRQQGLIHIYNTFCTQGRCNCCGLAGSS